MNPLHFFATTVLLTLVSPTVSSYQQHVLRFDEEESPQPSQPISNPTVAAPAPKPTGFTAKVIQRVTGWNDTVIAKLTGQISPRAPHPFVVMITDENYDRVIGSGLDEVQPGWGSADDTVWITVVSATDRVSSVFDDTFDEMALNASQAIYPPPPKLREDQIDIRQLAPDDPFLFSSKLRFGRIDYMGKTDVLLTKWLIFKCPVMVVISKRGQELRFFKIGNSPPPLDHLAQFIREEKWNYKSAWNSRFSPGGPNEWIIELLGKAFKLFHDVTDEVPGWLMMLVTSVLGTSLMQWLHHSSPPKSKKITSPKEKSTAELKAELARTAVELAHASSHRTQQGTEKAASEPVSTGAKRRKAA